MVEPTQTFSAERLRRLESEVARLTNAVKELAVLNDIAVAAGGKLSVDDTLNEVVEKALKAIGAEQGSLLIATDERERGMKTLVRHDARSSLRRSYHVGVDITGYVLHRSEPLLIPDLAEDTRFEASEEERSMIRSVLCVPVVSRGRLVGAMMMINKTGAACFTEDDQRMLTVVSSLAGQLLANRQLQDEASRRERELVIARLNAEKTQEIAEAKSRFFSNVSHEVRTPLALILGPLEELARKASSQEDRERFAMVRRNTSRLLHLINQLLDFSRSESGSLTLRPSQGDAALCLSAVASSYLQAAEQKGVRLTWLAPSELPGWFDQDKIEKIIHNLVSNAVKFTSAGGEVRIHLNRFEERGGDGVRNRVRIIVEDTGIGIPKEELESVFLRFYQAKNAGWGDEKGTGIGLAMVKEYTELHGGQVTVNSELGKGSTFVVTLPWDSEGVTEEAGPEDCKSEDPDADAGLSSAGGASVLEDDRSPLLLVVEDHDDMRDYIKAHLKGAYRLIEARDGGQAVELATVAGPDLVISDVLMPGLSGVELCRQLKSDIRTSHIPVILLTGVADAEGKLRGLECGADDYLTKPFSWSELETRIKNLLETRRRLRERFSKRVILDPGEFDIPSVDEAFLRRAHETVEANLGDESFTVEELARGVSLSYSQLHRKIRALTGMPPTRYIRSIRLLRARELLTRNSGTVSEIAYAVGFGSPKFFTECFREQFGVLPSEMRKT